jgi:hypothetical protein
MNPLKLIGLTLIKWVKQAGRLPETIAHVVKQGRRQSVLKECEAERLDRIRNPSKYLGK